MDLQQLQAFAQIALHRSFGKAARQLGISQPAISMRIRALEREVGGELFARHGRALALTDLGRSFLPYAQAALRAMLTGVDVARETMQGRRGRVLIGTLPTLAGGFFASSLTRLYDTHPHLDIAVHTGHNEQIVEMLYDHFIHVGFLTAPFFHPDVTAIMRVGEPLILVTHPHHPLTRLERVRLEDLADLARPFFLVDWSFEIRHWQAQAMARGGPGVEVPPQTAHDQVTRGRGAALLTASLVRADVESGRLAALRCADLPSLRRDSIMVRRAGEETLPPAIVEFLAIFREEAHECLLPL